MKISSFKFDWPFNLTQMLVGGLGTLLLAYLLFTQSPYAVMGFVVAVFAVGWIFKKPEYGLYLLIISVPGQLETSLTVGGSRITLTQIAVILAFAAWFASRIALRQPLIARPTPLLLPFFGLYLFVMLISLNVARNFGDSFNEMYRWGVTVFAYILATSLIQTRRQLWGLVIALGIGPVAEAYIGIQQSQLGIGPASYFVSPGLSRAFGTFDKPNSYAGYLEMGFFVLVALALLAWSNRNATMRRWLQLEGKPRPTERKALLKYYGLLALLVISAYFVSLGIYYSFSRGAWLGIAVGVLALIAIRGRKSIPIAIFGGIFLTLFVLGVQTGAIQASTIDRITTISEQFRPFDVRDVFITDENFAIVERMAHWQAGGNMVLYSPWLGVGIGNFNERYTEFSMVGWPESRGHAHNYYIHAAAETGLIGLAAYLLLIFMAIWQGWQVARRTKDRELKYLAWGAFGIIIAVATHNLVEDLHVLNMSIQWSVLLALFYLIPKQESSAN